jgi:lycopene cyclase domain-containing protein
MDRFQYLAVLGVCLVLTLPLEVVLGARVYRRPRRLLATLAIVVAPFVIWDVVAIARGHWDFAARYTTGWLVPGYVPVEEVAFFVVVPICALLTHGAVRRLRGGSDA